MREKIIAMLEVVGEVIIERGTDTTIFGNFLFYFRMGDYEACIKMSPYSLIWLDAQPYKQEIIDVMNLTHEYIKMISK